MTDRSVLTPDDPAFLAARAFLARRGVTAGPNDDRAEQLCAELGQRDWLWRLNAGDRSGVAGEYADATMYDRAPATGACTIAYKGTTAVVAVTMAPAEAMRSDDLTAMGRRD
jgi:hypothetical protein